MIDFSLLFLILFCVLIGFLRGFIKDFFGFLGLFCSFLVAYLKYDLLLDLFGLSAGPLVNFVSGFAVFIACIITAMLINGWLMLLFKAFRLGMVDRSFGFIFGFFKGIFYSYIALGLIVIFCHSFFYKEATEQNETEKKDRYLPDLIKSSSSYASFLVVDDFVNKLIPYRYNAKLESFGKDLKEKLETHKSSKNTDKPPQKQSISIE